MDRSTATSLTVQAKMWGTPNARDGKGSPGPGSDYISLPKQIATFGPHDPTTTTGGSNGTVLNPEFVAALMGLPTGWLTPSTSAATDSCPNAPQKPGASSPHDSTTDGVA